MKKVYDIEYRSRHHRRMMVNRFLLVRGVAATVTRALEVLNGYEDAMPEPEIGYPAEFQQTPDSFQCLVIVDTPLTGVETGNEYQSLTDKIDQEIMITSNGDLRYNDIVSLTDPDGKKLNLRVLEVVEKYAYSETGYKFSCIVI